MPGATKPNAVFLNVPFDPAYEKQFLALIAAVIALGRTPRCVLEVAETGTGRLSRIIHHMQRCEVSIHDLSRVGTPARFNMPFELGMACALAQLTKRHSYLLFERQRYRLQRTLSDLNGRDPYIHGGTIRGTIQCVLDALRAQSRGPDSREVFQLYRTLKVAADKLVGKNGSVFTRSHFLDLVAVGIERAAQTGVLAA
jgi:hypothetical protein